MRNSSFITKTGALAALAVGMAIAAPAWANGNTSGPDESFAPNGTMVIGSMQPATGPAPAGFTAVFEKSTPTPAHGCGSVAVHGQQGGVSYEDRCW